MPSASVASPSVPAAKKHPAAGTENTPSEATTPAEDLTDQVIVTFGRVKDIGRQAAEILLAETELAALRAADVASRTADQKRRLLELERQRATLLGALPEITRFQDDPAEYSRFFGSLLTQAAGLDATQSAAVAEYFRQRGAGLIAAGLNAAKEPSDPAQEEAWEAKRDEFNEETVDGAAKLLPPGTAVRIGFTDKFLELMEQDFDKVQ